MSFQENDSKENHRQYHLSTVKINYYDVMIDGKNFEKWFKNIWYDNIRKIATGQGDDYTTECCAIN